MYMGVKGCAKGYKKVQGCMMQWCTRMNKSVLVDNVKSCLEFLEAKTQYYLVAKKNEQYLDWQFNFFFFNQHTGETELLEVCRY